MFCAGISVIGIAHQVVWLATSEERLTRSSAVHHLRSTSKNNLKQMVLSTYDYHDENGTFPPGATMDANGVLLHSWQTLFLPQIEQGSIYKQIALEEPWNSPKQGAVFQTHLQLFINPGVDRGPAVSDTGYALSHYAGNAGVLNAIAPMAIKDITDGTRHTIFAGEVNSNFKPWGDPTNFRNVALGINQSSSGFGSPFRGGAQFSFCDGHVRFVNENIDPEVFRALGTPAGGEKIDEDDLLND
jgi:prepilin-type processing-associated H-X9-DG protein